MAFHLGYVADSDEEGWLTVMRNAALPCGSRRLVELVYCRRCFQCFGQREQIEYMPRFFLMDMFSQFSILGFTPINDLHATSLDVRRPNPQETPSRRGLAWGRI